MEASFSLIRPCHKGKSCFKSDFLFLLRFSSKVFAFNILKGIPKKEFWYIEFSEFLIPILAVWSHLFACMLYLRLIPQGRVPADPPSDHGNLSADLIFRINARLLVAELVSRVKAFQILLSLSASPFYGSTEKWKLTQRFSLFQINPSFVKLESPSELTSRVTNHS